MPWGDDAAHELSAEIGGRNVKGCMGNSPSGGQWPEYPEIQVLLIGPFRRRPSTVKESGRLFLFCALFDWSQGYTDIMCI